MDTPGSRCHPLVSVKTSGIDTAEDVDMLTRCERLSDRQCRVSYTCSDCSISKEVAKLLLHVKDGYEFTAAREIHWHVRADWKKREKKNNPNEVKAFSSVRSVVTTGNLAYCMRGAKPSLVRLAMVPTDYKDLITSTHLFGFVMEFIDARFGSKAGAFTFHQQPAELKAEVELAVSHSFYKLILSKKVTVFDFSAQILGFLSGMSLIARVSVASWHTLTEHRRRGVDWIWKNRLSQLLAAILCFFVPVERNEDDDEDDLSPKAVAGPNAGPSWFGHRGYSQVATSPSTELSSDQGPDQAATRTSGGAGVLLSKPIVEMSMLRRSEMRQESGAASST